MGKQRRYIASGGLAFTENRDMNKLSRLAAKGWLLESFASFGYYVRRGEPQQLVYSVDYNKVEHDELRDYVELFEASGWTKVCSQERIHIFSAPAGTKPIYTDSDTKSEKYKSLVRLMKPMLAVPLFTVIMFALLIATQSAESSAPLAIILKSAGILGLIPSVPILATYAFARIRLIRVK
ncbi:DUF2812 domain-containing protein [Paenibacillus oenotherae]|uniref:DUF2812 domain-containing protein n=1 Tax=Paenibacillus oenotherae TaxID=1435645 RepID=A0ABS7D6C4_9BACL|nr:DUF2812 domain-containing protein [Paenibacillus oenotherae]MBW7475450.1 DUF2812 domain-containing protein [Paenibacillus oenotherae]